MYPWGIVGGVHVRGVLSCHHKSTLLTTNINVVELGCGPYTLFHHIYICLCVCMCVYVCVCVCVCVY